MNDHSVQVAQTVDILKMPTENAAQARRKTLIAPSARGMTVKIIKHMTVIYKVFRMAG